SPCAHTTGRIDGVCAARFVGFSFHGFVRPAPAPVTPEPALWGSYWPSVFRHYVIEEAAIEMSKQRHLHIAFLESFFALRCRNHASMRIARDRDVCNILMLFVDAHTSDDDNFLLVRA